jgi:hypothetical protein
VRRARVGLPLSLALGFLTALQGQSGRSTANVGAASMQSSSATPTYRITFKEGSPVAGIGDVPVMAVPFQCTGDGTIFFSMIPPIGRVGQPVKPPSRFPMSLLISVSPSGEAHSFPLDQVPDLYDLSWAEDYYASDTQVIFLVQAAAEDKQGKRTYTTSDRAQHESMGNVAEHRSHIVIFDRRGNYQKKFKLEVPFKAARLGVFPSGTFLAYGYGETDRAPKLAILKNDGTLLKLLEIPKGGAPDSALGTKDASGKGPAVYLAPVQFVGQGPFIYVVQNRTKFPLLEVSEAGAIRVIKPRLPQGAQINTLTPSDQNLYAVVGEFRDHSMYELNSANGAVLRQIIQVNDDKSGGTVACVHDQKFLSFEHEDGKLVPLVGTAEPASGAIATDSVQK